MLKKAEEKGVKIPADNVVTDHFGVTPLAGVPSRSDSCIIKVGHWS